MVSDMRKLFRMKYESCTGRCYAYSDVLRIHTLGLDAAGAAEFLKTFIEDGDLVLIKASRGIGLDNIVTQLEGAH